MRREYLVHDCFSIALNNYLLKKKENRNKGAKEKIKERERNIDATYLLNNKKRNSLGP